MKVYNEQVVNCLRSICFLCSPFSKDLLPSPEDKYYEKMYDAYVSETECTDSWFVWLSPCMKASCPYALEREILIGSLEDDDV